MMISGLVISARPIASICCSPPLMVSACCFSRGFSAGNRCSTRSVAVVNRGAVVAQDMRADHQIVAHRHFRHHDAALRHIGDAAIDPPVRRLACDIGAIDEDAALQARSSPAATLIAVDLPAPLEPTMVVISRLRGTSSLTDRITATSP